MEILQRLPMARMPVVGTNILMAFSLSVLLSLATPIFFNTLIENEAVVMFCVDDCSRVVDYTNLRLCFDKSSTKFIINTTLSRTKVLSCHIITP